MARWGLPFRGSKSKIAEKILTLLPVGHRFVDLFGGGGAMSHCATRYYRQVLYNDIDPLTVEYFTKAINGDYDIRWIDRAEFNKLKNKDPIVKYIWSFSNNGRGYLYPDDIAPWKHALWLARYEGDLSVLQEMGIEDCSRQYLISQGDEIIKKYSSWLGRDVEHSLSIPKLQSLECLERMKRLEDIKSYMSNMEISNIDYRDYVHQDGDIVYCDIPYSDTEGYPANTKFDTEAFLDWVRTRPYQVYFSSYEAPDEFYKEEIATVTAFSGDKAHQAKRTEHLYSNGRIRKTIWEIIDDYSE